MASISLFCAVSALLAHQTGSNSRLRCFHKWNDLQAMVYDAYDGEMGIALHKLPEETSLQSRDFLCYDFMNITVSANYDYRNVAC